MYSSAAIESVSMCSVLQFNSAQHLLSPAALNHAMQAHDLQQADPECHGVWLNNLALVRKHSNYNTAGFPTAPVADLSACTVHLP